jgi:hypothetical protein
VFSCSAFEFDVLCRFGICGYFCIDDSLDALLVVLQALKEDMADIRVRCRVSCNHIPAAWHIESDV